MNATAAMRTTLGTSLTLQPLSLAERLRGQL